MEPIIDVIMPVYNHAPFLAQAIESIVLQQTKYKFRLLVGEDCSKDNSRDILRQYAVQYPDIIVPVYHEQNQGATGNSRILLSLVTAKYIGICEGDDFWTDMRKIEKQVDFLEANPGFSMCFSDVGILDETGTGRMNQYPPLAKDEFTIEDIVTAGYCFIPTATLIYRNNLPWPLPDFYLNAASGDIAMHLLIADKGKGKYLREKTAVYRHHAGGMTKSEEHIRTGDDKEFLLYEQANEYFGGKYDAVFRRRLLEMAKVKLVYGSRNMKGIAKLKYVLGNTRNYFKYSNRINIKEVVYYTTLLFFPSLLKKKK